MIEFHTDTSAAADGEQEFAVSVIGIGGAGANVIDRIALDGMPGTDLICMNCDVRALTTSMAGRKVQLGRNLTQGLGCGGDPELGLEAAMSSSQEIRELLAGRSMIFLSVGLGGGTGSGAAPYVARLAREAGAFVVVFATLPFSFEGRRRMNQAVAALQELRKHANALVTFENDRMGELIVPRKGVQEAFETADRIIGQSIRAVTSLVTQPGLIRIGMDDLITALRNTDSRCLFGFGQAKGENRGVEALNLALKSPLLDRGQMLSNARNVLVHVCGGTNVTLYEIETLMRELSRHVHEDAQILFGAATDTRLNEHLSVTIITSLSTGHAEPAEEEATPEADPASRHAEFLEAALQLRKTDARPGREPAPAAPQEPVQEEPGLFDEVRQPSPAREPEPAPLPDPEPEAVTAHAEPAPEVPAEEEEPEPEPVAEEDDPAVTAEEETVPDPEEYAEEYVEEEEYDEAPAAEEESVVAGDEVPSVEDDGSGFEPEPEPEPEPERASEPVRPRLRDIVNPAPARTQIRRPAPAPAARDPHPAAGAPPQQQTRPASRVQQAPPARPAPAPAPAPARQPVPRNQSHQQHQETFDERLTPADGGRFGSTQPNLEEGEDLDVPTFLRKKT